MSEAEKFEFEAEVDGECRIRIPADLQKASGALADSIVTIKMKPIMDQEGKPVEIHPKMPENFEFTDQVDGEGFVRIPEMIVKSSGTSPGFAVSASVEHVLREEKKEPAYKYEFLDKVDAEGRITIPGVIRSSAGIDSGDVVSVRLRHVLDSENRPVERIEELVDKFDFSSRVDEEGRITIPGEVREAVPIAPGSVVTVKMEQVIG
jgi:bifunctional DNA-binding transcriptional regulator/antitoxin component of YhaV-PrlF toxin-antitoxin module